MKNKEADCGNPLKEEVLDSEERYRLIAENTDDVIWVMDPFSSRFTYISPSVEKLCGYTPEEVMAQPVSESLTPESLRLVVDGMNVNLPAFIAKGSGKASFVNEVDQPCKDGSIIHTEVTTTFLFNRRGKVEIIGVSRNITEKKAAQEALKRQAHRLRILHSIDQSIVQATESPENIIMQTLPGILEILNCQSAAIGIFDTERTIVHRYAVYFTDGLIQTGNRNLDLPALHDMEMLRLHRKQMECDLDQPSPVSGILRTIIPEGIKSCINIALISADNLTGVLNLGWKEKRAFTEEEAEIADEVASQLTIAVEQALLREKSRQYTAELEYCVRHRTQQLEASNKELEAFTYSVSHDLRAPLRHISGFVSLLVEKYEELLPETGKHYIETILDSTRQMGTLIDDLLQFSRTGRQEMKEQNLDMNLVFNEGLASLVQETNGRDIQWKIADLPAVYGDHALLRIVWVNLLSNAIKFTRNKPRAVIQVGVYEEENETVFFICDNGAGFDMHYSHKLFGVFQRLHSTKVFEGTGIGLANVHRIVTKHNGRIWADAQPGEGATFYFSIPKQTQQEKWLM